MKVKVGQWKRRDNVFYEIIEVGVEQILIEYTLSNGKKTRMWKSKYWWDITPELYDFADTPQDLVQDMDIGFIKEWNTYETLHTSQEGAYCYMDGKRHFIGKDITITKILTPNANGDYIKQWEENNEKF